MNIYDISLPISVNIAVWPGDPPVDIEKIASKGQKSSSNVSRICMSVHTGTHVDAPYHFLNEGETVENLSLRLLTGRVHVIDFSDVDEIDITTLKNANIPLRTCRILFKTKNSNYWENSTSEFHKDFVAITPDGADYLVEKGVKLVGIDYFSIAPFFNPEETHRILLEAGIIIIEGINLSHVKPGIYSLFCLPLKIIGADGAPARTILYG